ncbi:GNAT family N-acetyltransferase [Arthrobacter sp. B2a2-09]|uniref:GNAT family N-acetyltransferase n=1 Tax=Arthrobacter sp. B2a2-09 TaxID=2952822 RepID=UPI0022CDB134|nr:GNAT family N-acetyltransferase [Arthrobacter sp. B2a2-09]MCZ9882926.1 GNAT family N-acetyltransferase [Arthrobacter sp. B2a2-09]
MGLKAEVRPAKGSDIAHILDVEAQAGRFLPDPARLAAAIDDDARLVLVACTRGTSDVGGFLGWGKTHFWGHDDGAALKGHYLGGVTVRLDCRRSGIGTALTQARLDWIWRRASEAWYIVNASNLASIELHRRWGFVEVARASRFHTTTFDGGAGILMRAARPTTPK